MKVIPLKTCGTFSVQGVEHLYLVDQDDQSWIYLKPVFQTSQKCARIVKKYSHLAFQKKKAFGNFSLPTFSRISPEALFLSLTDFEQIAVLEKKTEVLPFLKKSERTLDAPTSQTKLPKPGVELEIKRTAAVYIAELPDVGVAKFGLTQDTMERGRSLKRDYGKQAEIVYSAKAEDAPIIERKLRLWCQTKQALVSVPKLTGGLSRETFRFDLRQEAEAYLVQLVEAQAADKKQREEKKRSRSLQETTNQVLVEKLKTDNAFALAFYAKQKEIEEKEQTIRLVIQSWPVEEQQRFLRASLLRSPESLNAMTDGSASNFLSADVSKNSAEEAL